MVIKNSMEIGKIRIEGIKVDLVENIKIQAAINQHARLDMVCLIQKEQIQECVKLPLRESVVSVWEQDTELFCGTVTEAV